jgi:hypothetical protein
MGGSHCAFLITGKPAKMLHAPTCGAAHNPKIRISQYIFQSFFQINRIHFHDLR